MHQAMNLTAAGRESVIIKNEIFCRKKWISKDDLESLERKGLQLAKMLNALISSIKKNYLKNSS